MTHPDGLTDEHRARLRRTFAEGIGSRPDPETIRREAEAVAELMDEFKRVHGLDLTDEERAAKIRARWAARSSAPAPFRD